MMYFTLNERTARRRLLTLNSALRTWTVVVVEEEVAVEAAEAEKVEVVETEGEMTETEIRVEEEARDEVDEG